MSVSDIADGLFQWENESDGDWLKRIGQAERCRVAVALKREARLREDMNTDADRLAACVLREWASRVMRNDFEGAE